MARSNNYRDLLKFDNTVIEEVRRRQDGYCASCNNKLSQEAIEGSKVNAHHVIPIQSVEQHSELSAELVAFLRSPDNCVLLCSVNESNVGAGCHLHAAHGGDYVNGPVAPPQSFNNSHRLNTADQPAWIVRVETRWRLLFGKSTL